jgi:hypothetical protein
MEPCPRPHGRDATPRTGAPSFRTGGSIVLLAVAGHIWHEMRKEQAMAAL